MDGMLESLYQSIVDGKKAVAWSKPQAARRSGIAASQAVSLAKSLV
jgi:hypothetical protein